MKKKLLTVLVILFILLAAGYLFADPAGNNFQKLIFNTAETITNSIGGDALSRDKALQGERTFGEDKYEGTYTAEYQNFTGTENLFGGAALDRKSGDTLTVNSHIETQNGDIKIYWNSSGGEDRKLLLAETGSATVQLNNGWEYLSVEGNAFDGTITVEVD